MMLFIVTLILLILMLFNGVFLMLIFVVAVLPQMFKFFIVSTLWFSAPLTIFLGMICLLAYSTWSPNKCAYGILAGNFQGFLAHNKGIKVDKIKPKIY